ncbi:MAG: TetR/AcrR family transcriptional regulator [Halorhabdus sp.]
MYRRPGTVGELSAGAHSESVIAWSVPPGVSSVSEPPESEPSTEEAIMEATFRALCAHGYAGASISRIAEEFPKSKSLLYYHYEDKDDLLSDFLGYLLDQLEADLRTDRPDAADERLYALLDKLAPRDISEEHVQFFQALLEMRAQTAHEPAYREQFERSDDLIVAALTEAIETGIEDGDVRPVDAEATAEFVLATLYGGLDRAIPLDDPEKLVAVRDELDRYLETQLLIDDG